MTRAFVTGFMHKCAESRLSFEAAKSLLEKAAVDMYTEPADGFQGADSEGRITMDGGTGYVMRDGDTVSHILQRAGIEQKHLGQVLRENGLDLESAKKLRPGSIINVGDPESYGTTSVTNPPAASQPTPPPQPAPQSAPQPTLPPPATSGTPAPSATAKQPKKRSFKDRAMRAAGDLFTLQGLGLI